MGSNKTLFFSGLIEPSIRLMLGLIKIWWVLLQDYPDHSLPKVFLIGKGCNADDSPPFGLQRGDKSDPIGATWYNGC